MLFYAVREVTRLLNALPEVRLISVFCYELLFDLNLLAGPTICFLRIERCNQTLYWTILSCISLWNPAKGSAINCQK